MEFVVDCFIPIRLPSELYKHIDVFLKITIRNGNICNSSKKAALAAASAFSLPLHQHYFKFEVFTWKYY